MTNLRFGMYMVSGKTFDNGVAITDSQPYYKSQKIASYSQPYSNQYTLFSAIIWPTIILGVIIITKHLVHSALSAIE